ncbi:MAG: hypothetical protein PHE25_00560 [Candidatus Gracilibacteria bacterium]|nr:hypothetical protein [Candidatus Gracilibacteria bacterium]
MKKITTLAILPLMALASCSKNEEKVETPKNTPIETTQQTTPEVATPTEVTNSGTETQEILNQNISTGITNESGVSIKEFKLTYNLPDGKPLNFNGNLEIEGGKIKSVNFPEYDLINDQSYEVKFAQKLQSDIVGKEIKGLQYDGMSGASLTTNAFNEFLNTINK